MTSFSSLTMSASQRRSLTLDSEDTLTNIYSTSSSSTSGDEGDRQSIDTEMTTLSMANKLFYIARNSIEEYARSSTFNTPKSSMDDTASRYSISQESYRSTDSYARRIQTSRPRNSIQQSWRQSVHLPSQTLRKRRETLRIESSSSRELANLAKLKRSADVKLAQIRLIESAGYGDFLQSLINDSARTLREPVEKRAPFMCQGFPYTLRGELWYLIAESRGKTEKKTFEAHCNRPCPFEKIIERDMAASEFFINLEDSQYNDLLSVIKAFNAFDYEAYDDHLLFLVYYLISQAPKENAFAILVKLMTHYGMRPLYTSHKDALQEKAYQFDRLLSDKLPIIYAHLRDQGVTPDVYLFKWFSSFFSIFSRDLGYHMIDLVIVEGFNIMFQCALALISKNETQILELPGTALVDFFNDNIYGVYQDDSEDLVREAYTFPIPAKYLDRLAKEYAAEQLMETKAQVVEEGLKSENIQLADRVATVERMYKTLELDHQSITRQAVDTKLNMARVQDENEHLQQELNSLQHEREMKNEQQLREVMMVNLTLKETNHHLEDKLVQLENELVELKMKFAELACATDEAQHALNTQSKLSS